MGKLKGEWISYEVPSYGFPEYEGYGKKKYGVVGGLGVVTDEILSRISKEVDITAIGMKHLRGRDLPEEEEIDGYKALRPSRVLSKDETIGRCAEAFNMAGIEFNGIHINEIPSLPFLADYGLLIPEITDKTPHLILAHDWMAILGSYKKALTHKIPWTAFFHSLEAGRAGGMIHTLDGPKENNYGGAYAGSRTIRDAEALGIKKADVCLTVGKNMVEEVKKIGVMHGIPAEEIEKKTYAIHHGIDTKTFYPMGLDKKYDAIFIARFAKVKGTDKIIDATKILKNKHPDFKLRMVGGGEEEGHIFNRIKNEDLEKNISVTTAWLSKEQKREEINKAKVAVAPSKYEPHGQFDLEAGACGVPCINGTGGFMERMVNDVTALQCNPFDPRDIADKMDYLLSNHKKREEIGRNAREFTVKYYDWDKRAKIYPDIFEAIVSGELERLREIELTVNLEETEFA